MTQDELDQLPDATPSFGCRVEIRDGKEIRIPVWHDPVPGAFSHDPDDPLMVTDDQDVRWMIGRVNGVLHKRRLFGW